MDEIYWENLLHKKHNRFKIKIFEFISELIYKLKLFYQRNTKGYDDNQVGDIDFYLMKLIPKLLIELKNKKPGLSTEFFDGLEMNEFSFYSEENEAIARERFELTIDKIVDGFKAYEKMNYELDDNREESKKKFDEGFELFHRYFNTLNN